MVNKMSLKLQELIEVATKKGYISKPYNRGTMEDKPWKNTDTIPTQNKHNTDTIPTQGIVGIQELIIEWMFLNIKNNKKKETKKLTMKIIAQEVNVNENSVKTTIQRLRAKDLIIKKAEKRGRNGWIIFAMNDSVFKTLDNLKKESSSLYNSNTTIIDKYKGGSVQNLASPENTDELIANLQKENDSLKKLLLSSGLSSVPANPTPQPTPATPEQTTEPTQQNLDDWDNIDFSALEPYGFRKCKIKQIRNYNTTLTPKDVEDSIEHYAWALANRREEMKGYAPENNPLKGLFGVLKKGNPWIEAAYQSPEELAIEAQTNAAKRRLERINKQKEEALETNYQLWRAEMSDEEYKQMRATLPSMYKDHKDGGKALESVIKLHFKNNIYNKGER